MKTSTAANPPATLARMEEQGSITAALALFGEGHTRRVSEEKLAAKQEVALIQDGQDLAARPEQTDVPASRLARRSGGASDPRLASTTPVGSKHAPVISAAQEALQRATALIDEVLVAPPGPGAELLPKAIAAVTGALNAVRPAATLFGSGRAEAGKEEGLQAAFAALLGGAEALRLKAGVPQLVEQPPSYAPGLALLSRRANELRALAPYILGPVDAGAKAEQRPTEAADLAATRDTAAKLGQFLERDPQFVSAEVRGTLSFLKDVGLRVGWYRDGGQHLLYCTSSLKTKKGKSVSLDEVASAVREAQQHLGLEPLPFVTSSPKATASRMEEAWGLLHRAFSAQDPESRARWQPGGLHLHAPSTGLFSEIGGWSFTSEAWPGLNVDLYSNDGWLARADHPSFKKGTAEGLERELRSYLAGHGLGDVPIAVKKARRPLTPEHAEAIRDRLEALRTSASKPAGRSPEALLQTRVSEIKVERDPHSNELEVAVYVPASGTGYYGEPLLQVEEAVRAILSDDPSTIGARIRIKLDPQEDQRGFRPQMISVLFGQWTTPEQQARAKTDDEAQGARLAPYVRSFQVDRRTQGLDRFAAGGPVQSELVSQMKHDPEEAKGEWKAALRNNLAAWFLGVGAAEPAWTRRFEQLPLAQRADFLELALKFLDGPVPPTLVEASRTFRRLNGRVDLERTCTQNGTQSAAQMAETDAIFKQGLGGRAKEVAFAALADARAPTAR